MVLTTGETMLDENKLVFLTVGKIFVTDFCLLYINIPSPLTFIIVYFYTVVGWPNLEVNPESLLNFLLRSAVDFGHICIGLFGFTVLTSLFAMNTTIWDYWNGHSWPRNVYAGVIVNNLSAYFLTSIIFSVIRLTINFFTFIGILIRRLIP